MANLSKKADIIIPNMTEACFLVGEPYPEDSYNENFIINLLEKMQDYL